MSSRNNRSAFTLIEVLVVVAIIALLVAILLPSLSRAREQARMVQCGTNTRTLATAFTTYAAENKGRFPGSRGDDGADWLGRYNPGGRQPENGTVWKHMGKDKASYACPGDTRKNASGWYSSYTANLLLSGAKAEMLANAHYPTINFDRVGHKTDMKPFNGVPMIIEEDLGHSLETQSDSGWCNEDGFTDRHMKGGGDKGRANVGFHDTHVGQVRLPAPPDASTPPGSNYFAATNLCIRLTSGKWVSGKSWIKWGMYGILDSAPRAEDPDKAYNDQTAKEDPGGGGIIH